MNVMCQWHICYVFRKNLWNGKVLPNRTGSRLRPRSGGTSFESRDVGRWPGVESLEPEFLRPVRSFVAIVGIVVAAWSDTITLPVIRSETFHRHARPTDDHRARIPLAPHLVPRAQPVRDAVDHDVDLMLRPQAGILTRR